MTLELSLSIIFGQPPTRPALDRAAHKGAYFILLAAPTSLK